MAVVECTKWLIHFAVELTDEEWAKLADQIATQLPGSKLEENILTTRDLTGKIYEILLEFAKEHATNDVDCPVSMIRLPLKVWS